MYLLYIPNDVIMRVSADGQTAEAKRAILVSEYTDDGKVIHFVSTNTGKKGRVNSDLVHAIIPQPD